MLHFRYEYFMLKSKNSQNKIYKFHFFNVKHFWHQFTKIIDSDLRKTVRRSSANGNFRIKAYCKHDDRGFIPFLGVKLFLFFVFSKQNSFISPFSPNRVSYACLTVGEMFIRRFKSSFKSTIELIIF